MKNSEWKQKPNKESGGIGTRIVIENILEDRVEPSDGGVGLQMTLFFFSTRATRIRASKLSVAQFHGGFRFRPFYYYDREVSGNPETWLVKIVCTLFVRSNTSNTCFDYFSRNLSPSIAFEVIKWLKDPKLGLKFFELTKLHFGINHGFRTYDFLMRSLCQRGLHDSAKIVFDCMRSDGILPDSSIVEILVSSYASLGDLDSARKFLGEVRCYGIKVTPFVYNYLLNLLVKRNQVDEAVLLFRENMESHSHPDICTFNILIRGLCRIGEVDMALEFFNKMRNFGCSPDLVTYNTLINGFCRVNEVGKGHDLLKELKSVTQFSPDVVTYTSIISGYCKSGKMETASGLLDEMFSSGIKPNAFTFNVLINGFGKFGDTSSALAMYEKMIFLGCSPDIVTYTSLIDSYCRAGQVNQGLKIWHEMQPRNITPNVYTFAVLINYLCKENRLNEARTFLMHLKSSDVIPKPFIYNPVIDGFCKAGNVDEAIMIVAEMKEKRCHPDKVTFTILIIGYCMKGRMSEAISIFGKMLEVGCAPDEFTVNSLISCLLKAGMPNEATRIKQTASENPSSGLSTLRSNFVRKTSDIPVAV